MSILETTCYFVKGVPDGIRKPLCLTLIDPSPGEYCLVDSVYLFGEDKASLPVIDKSRRNMWSPSKQEKKLCSYKKMIFWHVYFFRCVFVCNGNNTAPQQVKTKFRWRGKM